MKGSPRRAMLDAGDGDEAYRIAVQTGLIGRDIVYTYRAALTAEREEHAPTQDELHDTKAMLEMVAGGDKTACEHAKELMAKLSK